MTTAEMISSESLVKNTITPLEKAAQARKEQAAAGTLIFRSPMEKASANPNSRKLAIDAKCQDCQGAEGVDSGWKWAIGNCAATDCPLYGFRPYQKKYGRPPEGAYRVQAG